MFSALVTINDVPKRAPTSETRASARATLGTSWPGSGTRPAVSLLKTLWPVISASVVRLNTSSGRAAIGSNSGAP